MKKIKKVLCILAVVLAIPTSVMAATQRSYSFSFPDYTGAVGSLRWSKKMATSNGNGAFVQPQYAVHSTNYFLAASKDINDRATEVATTATISKKPFTFLSGYGGSGTSYYLGGYPDSNYPYWASYIANGTFGFNN